MLEALWLSRILTWWYLQNRKRSDGDCREVLLRYLYCSWMCSFGLENYKPQISFADKREEGAIRVSSSLFRTNWANSSTEGQRTCYSVVLSLLCLMPALLTHLQPIKRLKIAQWVRHARRKAHRSALVCAGDHWPLGVQQQKSSSYASTVRALT